MPISFSYVHGFGDYRAFTRVARRPTRREAGLRFLVLVAMYVAMMLVIDPALRSPSGWAAMLSTRPGLLATSAVLVVFAAIARFDHLATMWLGWFWYRRLAAAGRRVTVVLDEAAVMWSLDGVSGRMEWSAIRRAVEMADRMLLFIGPLEGLMIPRRAFADEAAYTNALEFVKAHVVIQTEKW